MKIKLILLSICFISLVRAKATPKAVPTERGNANGAPCVFPFLYKGEQYDTCTEVDVAKGFTWCSTTSNYDTDKKWGYCPPEKKEVKKTDTAAEGPVTHGGNSNGAPCKFPFTYKGNVYDKCTAVDDQFVREWCATSSDYGKDKKWGFCPKDPNQVVNPFILEEVELTKENIKKYLEHHNKLRAEVGPERATNMLELTWDEDLATVAKAWSRECKYGHSAPENRRTTAFRWTGENAYFRYPPWEIDQVLARSLTSFMKEKPRFTYGKFGASDTGTKYGHYAQMMWANSYKVGCGVTNCGNFYSGGRGEYWAKAQVVICTYGPGGNIVGQYPWESGKTCSNCPADKTCLCTP